MKSNAINGSETASRSRGRIRRRVLGVAFGVLGVAVAQLVYRPSSHACSCVEPSWWLARVDLEAAPGAPDHDMYWPAQARLEAPDFSLEPTVTWHVALPPGQRGTSSILAKIPDRTLPAADGGFP
jgi:hypothetical protein